MSTVIAALVATACGIGPIRRGRRPPVISLLYFLFIGGSSTNIAHMPLGLAFEVPFLMTLIFILLSYAALAASCASEISADSKLGL